MPLTPFESSCLKSFQNGEKPNPIRVAEQEDLLRFGIWLLLNIARLVRGKRYFTESIEASLKHDGSPVTKLELEIEDFVRGELSLLPHDTVFISEESGGILPKSGLAVVLDPIDGTRSFLAQSETFSTSLAFYLDSQPIIGMVINPSTGELGYVAQGMQTRLIQISLFGESHVGVSLPTKKTNTFSPTLVNVHPSSRASTLVSGLYGLWRQDSVRFVRSCGGSPAYALLDAAKGHFIYVNIWDRNPSAPFDLAAGIMLVRGAGGEVLDVHEKPVKFNDHTGPIIAGVWNDERLPVVQTIIKRIRESLQI